MKERLRTKPNLIDTSSSHQEAIKSGTDHYSAWQYNVIDKFKDKTVSQIKSELAETANPFAVCMEHIIGDFNFGTVIRNANAFNAKEVFYVGDKKWDRRSALGTYNYTDVTWLSTIDEFIKLKDKYTIIGIDNIPGAKSINDYPFKKDTLFIFGEEGVGITPIMQSMCNDMVYIPQYGSVRSLNVGTASGIVMHQFVSNFHK